MPNRTSNVCLIALLAAPAAWAQTTAIDLSNQAKEADFRFFSFTRTIKTGTALPATCTVGDLFLLSTAASGRSLHVCQSANVWSLQGGEIASTTEAQAGVDDQRTMTPLKTAQAIAAQCPLPDPSGMAGAFLRTDGSASNWTRRLSVTPLTEAITGPAHTISSNRSYVQVNPSASVTLTSIPNIAHGEDGQFLVLANVSSSFSVTLQDQLSLPGSGLRLSGANLTLGPYQSVYLVYSSASSAWIRADQVPAGTGGGGAVTSVFGRVGAVTAQAGDYNASQITNAVSTAGSYADPSWITSLAYSKLTGAPVLQYQSLRINGGSDLPQRSRINFVAGPNVALSAADDAAGNQTTITVSATGGGGGGGPASPTTKTYMAAKCQNTVAGAGFSMGTTDAPTPLCDSGSNTLFGVLRFTADGQRVFDSFPLPTSFTGISAVVTARTASTSGNTVFAFETACVGSDESLGSGGSGGPAWNPPQLITLAARSTANHHTISADTPLTVTGCSANELFLFRISRHSSTTTSNPELISVSFQVQ